ncbi:MAG: hypothetical protein QXI77_00285 [Nanopusillaceae archaeon]
MVDKVIECKLCGKLLHKYEINKAYIEESGKKIEIFLCDSCKKLLFYKRTFAILKNATYTELKKGGDNILIQGFVSDLDLKFPLDKIDKFLIIGIVKEES